MAVTKIRKMSSWTLLIVSLISIVVLGMFFGGGIALENALIEVARNSISPAASQDKSSTLPECRRAASSSP